MRKLIVIAVLAALAIPAAALADDTAPAATAAPTANETCKLQLGQLGPATFRLTHGTLPTRANAFGRCVSRLAAGVAGAARNAAKECNAEQVDAVVDAAKTCKTERAADAAAFRGTYGTGPSKANAFGKCVSKTVQQAATTA
jgi:hypothetical protein